MKEIPGHSRRVPKTIKGAAARKPAIHEITIARRDMSSSYSLDQGTEDTRATDPAAANVTS